MDDKAYCWLISLSVFDAFDRPLCIATTPEEAFTAINDFTNQYLKKIYRCSRDSLLIYRIPLNDTSDTRELWTVESLLGLIMNGPTNEIHTEEGN